MTAPVTDYLKRSVLTAVGDILIGDPLDHDRIPSGASGKGLYAHGAGTKPTWEFLSGDLGTYLKGKGAGVVPAYEKLRLDDSGVFIAFSTRNAAGEQVIDAVGYKASVILFFACDSEYSLANFSWGFSILTNSACIYRRADPIKGKMLPGVVIQIQNSDTDYITSNVIDIDSAGFTLLWLKSNYGSADFIYLCLP